MLDNQADEGDDDDDADDDDDDVATILNDCGCFALLCDEKQRSVVVAHRS
jgi:hypothetical protein